MGETYLVVNTLLTAGILIALVFIGVQVNNLNKAL